jgi:tetratricopeptide (TPR) repeat protein
LTAELILLGNSVGISRLWDVATGKALGPPLTQEDPVTAVAFSPDGRTLFTAGNDKMVHIWSVPEPRNESSGLLDRWTQARGGMELDPDGGLVGLPPDRWAKMVHSLRETGGLATIPEEKAVEILERQRQEAEFCELDKQWFAATVHWTQVANSVSSDAQEHAKVLLRRGRAYGELQDWQHAADDYGKVLSVDAGDPETAVRHAWLCWAGGDARAYQASCRERFGRTESARLAQRVAWTCSLGPDAVRDKSELVRLADQGARSTYISWLFPATRGAALYRAGRWSEALQSLTQEIRQRGGDGTLEEWLFLAMTHQRLGQKKQAAEFLAKAAKELIRLEQRGMLTQGARVELHGLQQQAEGLLKKGAP